MIKQQKLPQRLVENKLKNYAENFFGFGNWKADCWLLGTEERGCDRDQREFCKRYAAWKSCNFKQLVNLKTFFRKCCLKKTPDWNNKTWRNLHCLCRLIRVPVGKLSKDNARWGSEHKNKSGSVALIEISAFPAPSSSAWPYERWRQFSFMKTKRKCIKEFANERTKCFKVKLEKYQPRIVIAYGNDGKNFGIKCKENSIVYRTSMGKVRQWKFNWTRLNKRKTLFVCVDHVSRMPLKVLVDVSDKILEKL